MSHNRLTKFIFKALAICFGALVLVGNGAQAEEQPSVEQMKFYPISLKCPAGNGDVLELASQNKLGWVQHISVTYVNEAAAVLIVSGHVQGEEVHLDNIDIRTEPDPVAKKYAEAVFKRAGSVKAVCEGPPEKRSEYFATLKANRRLLGLP